MRLYDYAASAESGAWLPFEQGRGSAARPLALDL